MTQAASTRCPVMSSSPSSGGKPGPWARLSCTGHWLYWRAESETPLSYWHGCHRASGVKTRGKRGQMERWGRERERGEEFTRGSVLQHNNTKTPNFPSSLTHPRSTSNAVTPSDHQSTSKAYPVPPLTKDWKISGAESTNRIISEKAFQTTICTRGKRASVPL